MWILRNGWYFLLVPGVLLLIGAGMSVYEHKGLDSWVPLTVWGVILSLGGGIPLYWQARKRQRNEWRKLNGRMIEAAFAGVHLDRTLTVNDRHPYRVHATQGEWTFKSDYLWSDPAPHIHSKTISVLLDPANPKRYWMDLRFLPKAD